MFEFEAGQNISPEEDTKEVVGGMSTADSRILIAWSNESSIWLFEGIQDHQVNPYNLISRTSGIHKIILRRIEIRREIDRKYSGS